MTEMRPDAASPPLVSVILPTRDRLGLLQRAVTSVRAQSEQRFELIVVDDASADRTAAFLEELCAADSRVRVVRNALPVGGAAARNAGVRVGRGAWIAFIDDDDEWLPHKLERQLRVLESNPTAVACSCSYIVRAGSRGSRVIAVRRDATLQHLLIANCLGGASSCICSRSALLSIGAFDAKLKSAQDLDLWIRLRRVGTVAVCPEPLVVNHAHPGGRITTNAHWQYLGVRRFYFKHRAQMGSGARAHWIAYCCYVMSTQTTRRLRRRLRYLALATLSASPRYALGFVKRSAPLLVRDFFFRNTAALRGAS